MLQEENSISQGEHIAASQDSLVPAAVDSLAQPVFPDSLALDSLADSLAADDIASELAVPGAEVSPWTVVEDPALVFGAESYAMRPMAHVAAKSESLTENVPYQFSVLAALALFVYFVAVHRGQAASVVRMTGRRKSDGRKQENHVGIKRGFMYGFIFTGMLLSGIALVRIASLIRPDLTIGHGEWLPVEATGLVMLAMGGVSLFQSAALAVMCSLVFYTEFGRRLIYTKSLFFMAYTLAAAPFVLLMSLAGQWWASAFACVYGLVVVISAISYVYRTMVLFVEQKVSILFWFLYLCTVEAMPWCIVIMTALRSI